MDKKNLTPREILNELLDLTFGSEEEIENFSLQELDERLSLLGVDTKKFLQRNSELLRKHESRRKLLSIRLDRLKRLSEIPGWLNRHLPQIQATTPRVAEVMMRNFAGVSEIDMESLEHDLAILDGLNEPENGHEAK